MNDPNDARNPAAYSRGYLPRLFVSAVDQRSRAREHSRSSGNSNDALTRYTRHLRTATWWIASLAILQFGAALLQWNALDKTDKTTRESLLKAQRAFVTVARFEISQRMGKRPDSAEDVEYWWFVPVLENSGNTPTKNMRYLPLAYGSVMPNPVGVGPGQGLHIDSTNLNEPADPEDVWNGESPAWTGTKVPTKAAVIGPHASFPIGGIGITDDFLLAVKNGVPFFFYGMVQYNDAFLDSDLHVTKFCYRINPYMTAEGQIGVTYGLCNHWNCADEECQADKQAYNAEMALNPKANSGVSTTTPDE